MTAWRAPGEARRRLPELCLTLMVIASVVNVAIRFHYDGKLPQPYLFESSDTFMDWFNTAFWAHNRGAFDVWRTVYPPLSFAFLKLFTMPECYAVSGLVARDCDWVGLMSIGGWYLLGSAAAALAFWRAEPRTALFRSTCFALGLPWLFTLERGNLILPSFFFFVLAHGGIARSRLVRAVAVGMTINFKPYLLLPALGWAVKRRWRSLELAGFASIAIYAITCAVYGEGDPTVLVANASNWVQFNGSFLFEVVYYSTSYTPFLEFATSRFPTHDLVPSRLVEVLSVIIPILTRSSQLMALVTLAGAWLQPRALGTSRVALLLLATAMITQSPGGYTEVYLIFLLFLERWERPGPIVALITGYLLSLSYDLVLANFVTLQQNSWLAGRPVTQSIGIAVGVLARPALVLIMFWALALDSILLIARAHREHRPTLALDPTLAPA